MALPRHYTYMRVEILRCIERAKLYTNKGEAIALLSFHSATDEVINLMPLYHKCDAFNLPDIARRGS